MDAYNEIACIGFNVNLGSYDWETFIIKLDNGREIQLNGIKQIKSFINHVKNIKYNYLKYRIKRLIIYIGIDIDDIELFVLQNIIEIKNIISAN